MNMICNICGRYGIYWKNLGGFNQHTYCPCCGGINCQKEEEEQIEGDEVIYGNM